MKTIKTLLMLVMVLLVSVIACKKEEVPIATSTPIPTSTINLTDQFFSDNIAEAVQLSIVDVSNWTSITGSGTEIWMGPGSFVDANGDPVTGNVDVELIVARDNKDMLMLNRPTVTSNGELLNSTGIIYINATQAGEQLQIANGLSTNMDASFGETWGVSIWNGDVTDNGEFVWIEDPVNALDFDSMGWYFYVDTIGWTNLDVLVDLGQGVLTGDDLSVVLPSGLNGGNSVVMMYFTSINSFASIYDSNQDGTFTPGYYEVPIGTTPKFVVVSMVNNTWSYYVSPTITITGPTTTVIVDNIDMLTATSEQDAQDQVLLLLQ